MTTIREEWELFKSRNAPVGSRRRRAAQQQTTSIPFDKLPYQCFQEARKVLIDDRTEKLKDIDFMRKRIEKLQTTDPNVIKGGEQQKEVQLRSMQHHLQHLKILADINDPNVKRRFEDGKGDMNKPIYRHLAERKWREYRRLIQEQRMTQMNLVPDVIPACDTVVDVSMAFGHHQISPGDFVNSKTSETPLRLNIQSFERSERLLTIAVVDPDHPNLETDSFDSKCHFLATNIPVDPLNTRIQLSDLADEHIMLPWLPPTAQKGSPYHRLAVIIFQNKNNVPVDREVAMKRTSRETNMRSLMTRHMLTPIAATLFRIKWDENMAEVMARHEVEGADVELRRRKVEPLPYKRRNPSSFR